jgi:dolichol-phosphate mannosyltransferase
MDADLQHPGEKLNEIYGKLNEGYDIVVASRYVDGGSIGRREPLRGLISRLAEFYAKLFLVGAKKTTDPLSGYFGFRRGLKLEVNEQWRGYKSLLFLLSSNPNAKVKDVPYKFLERVDGKSKIVGSSEFIRIYLSEIILAKRLEVKNRKSAK